MALSQTTEWLDHIDASDAEAMAQQEHGAFWNYQEPSAQASWPDYSAHFRDTPSAAAAELRPEGDAGRGGEPKPPLRRKMGRAPAAAQRALAELLVREQRWGQAQQLLLDLVRRSAQDVDDDTEDERAANFFHLGVCYEKVQGHELAVQCYQAALQNRPNLQSAMRNLMLLYARMEMAPEAVELAERQTQCFPEDSNAFYDAGVLNMLAGHPMAACAHYERALALNPRDAPTYANYDQCLLALGRMQDSHESAKRCIAHIPTGFWTDPMQRPPHIVPNITATPWHDPTSFPLCQALEEAYPVIKRELFMLLGSEPTCMPEQWEEVGKRLAKDADILSAGEWREMPFYSPGGKEGLLARQCPRTQQLLDAFPEVIEMARTGNGESLFSALKGGTTLRPHCGSTNARLTCHLGLVVPPGPKIRVGREWRTWEAGKCIVFDDSFEHEVRHEGQEPRIVLLVNFWHPGVPRSEWKPIHPAGPSPPARQMMR